MTDSPPPDQRGTEELVHGALRGDPAAQERWYELEFPRVYRLAFGLLADAAEAEDVAQESMLHLLDHLSRWDPERAYATWRNAVVVNRARDRMRRIDVRRKAERAAAEERTPFALPAPEDAARRGEVEEILERTLRDLSPREREVFVLRDLQGSSSAETAAVLDIGESTVRSLLSLARKRLRRLIEGRMPDVVRDLEGGGVA